MTVLELRFEPGNFRAVNRLLPTRPPFSVVLIQVADVNNKKVILIFGANFEWKSEKLWPSKGIQ
jgi:hypothetical protein